MDLRKYQHFFMMNKCCLVNYKMRFTVYLFRVTNTDNIPYELYRNSESWFNPKLKTIPSSFFLRWRWQYVHWRLAQSNKTATLLCQPSTRRQCHGTRPNAFNSIRVLLHDTVWFRFQPFHPIEQCRGNRERERERRGRSDCDWLPPRPWFMVMGTHVPRVRRQLAAGRTQQHHGRAAGTAIPATSRHTSSPFFSQLSTQPAVPSQYKDFHQ